MDKENRQNGNFQTNSTKAFRENIKKQKTGFVDVITK